MSERVKRTIGAFLCEDIFRGRSCPHHEHMAEQLYSCVVQAQAVDRQENAQNALDAIEARVKGAKEAA